MGVKAGVISIDIDAGTAKFLVDMDKSNAKLAEFGKSAQQSGLHVVSSMQASSAAIRLLENPLGNNLRAVERFISMMPGLSGVLKNAFPIVGLVAFGDILIKLGKSAFDFYKKMEEAPQRMATAFNSLNQPLQLTNDELTLANDKLGNAIAKLEGKPQNGALVALDETRVMADRLAESLDRDLDRIQKVMAENKTPWYQLLTPGTSDADKRAGQLRSQVASDKGNPAAQSQDFQHELQNVQSDLMKALEANAPHSVSGINAGSTQGGSATAEVARLREYAAQYQSEIDRIAAEQKQSAQTQVKDKLEAGKANAEAIKQAGEKQASAQRQADEDAIAAMKSDHDVSTAELIAFYEKRKGVDAGNLEYQHGITDKLGALRQEERKQVEGDAKPIQEYAEKIHEAYRDVQRSIDETAHKFEDYGYQAARAMEKSDAADKITSPLNQNLRSGASVKLGTQTFQYPGILPPGQSQTPITSAMEAGSTVGSVGSQIGTLQRQLSLQKEINQPIAAQLETRKQILEKQMELAQIEGKSTEQLALQLSKLQAIQQLQQAQSQWKAQLTGKIGQDASGIAGGLGGGLAKGIIDGKGIGKDIKSSLTGIGKEMLGDVLSKSVEQMVIAITGQTIATNAQTIATWALEAATYVAGLLGFADGGSPPVGRPSIVGERGPELFVPTTAGQIIPNHMLSGAGGYGNRVGPSYSGSSHSFSIGDIHVHGITDPDEFVHHVARKLPNVLKSTSGVFGPTNR